ncbi:hypothetical protein J416_15367 [Gracilibacillus halophilus YIM-C55.5]|uniref:ABM domain-containing protein n=1 Tax=Gracilibacillus halophilus YIM-C55.5 TaxID=1308866 RepID=N4W5X2_9BACI|nr:antibiotic biosynthesis monooxygenase [Gracilibacillus halophilus]ENH95583.1 hypothetical protein J416_15367 [Gracilibacillus halophilus YIM-C55.5]
MYAYMTNGTYTFLKKIKEKYQHNYEMIVMHNGEKAIAYYQSEQASIFETSRDYEVIVEKGGLKEEGFIVLNHIPVTDEGKPLFETQFKERAEAIENTSGFYALRVLRPLRGNTYIVMVEWEDQASFQHWKNSDHFQKAHNKKEKPSYMAGPSYSESLQVGEEERMNKTV